jgi:hypothetical protein
VSDWDKELEGEDKEAWERFVTYQREHTLHAMADSAFVMSIVPKEDVDIKFAVELGMAIMLNKPLFCVVQPDAEIPDKLRRVADFIAFVDIDTEEGKETLIRQIEAFQDRQP